MQSATQIINYVVRLHARTLERVAQELLWFAINTETPWVQQMVIQILAKTENSLQHKQTHTSTKHYSPALSIILCLNHGFRPAASTLPAQEETKEMHLAGR